MESLPAPFTVKIVGTALTVLLCWRLWRFTIRPALYPHEPKELPYWIPFVGHALGFFRDFNGALEKGKRHFHPSREPFTMVVAGQTIYVATSPEDINAVWKNTKTIDRNPLVLEMYTLGGLSEKSKKIVSDVHESAQYNANNERPLAPFQMGIKLHQKQLHRGPPLDALVKDRILPGLSKQLRFSNASHPAIISRSNQSTVVSLFQLCVDSFIAGGTDAYWGPKLREIAPQLIPAFVDWEYLNWKFIFQLPGFLSRDMQSSKMTIVNGFADYYRLPQSERPGALDFALALEEVMREIGFTEEDMGIFTLLHYWAIVGNTYKLAFWLVAHLVHNVSLMEEIRQEILPAVEGEHINEIYLLGQCPKLDSLSSEILRLAVASSLARVTTGTSVVGGKILKPGRKIMLPISQLHSDPQIWGHQPDVLQPNRFYDNPKLSKSLAYRPWGGGHGLCPGRFLARRSANAFVAMLLSRYDVEVEQGGIPQADDAKPSPGAASVAQGKDVRLRCTPRI